MRFLFVLLFFPVVTSAQLKWTNVDSLFGSLPSSVHVFYTNDSMFDGKPNIAYYVIADLRDRKLDFTTDTSQGRRLTPAQFFGKNDQPLLVVNCTFFSFETNRNLNLVMKKGKTVAFNHQVHALRGKDTLKYAHVFPSAIGINRKRNADVAWLFTDSAKRKPYSVQHAVMPFIDSVNKTSFGKALHITRDLKKWKMRTAVGGGPVLVQNGEIKISNNEERKFGGKAINDKHPRTAMGYTKDGRLIILVVQGRFPNIAEGVTLTQEAQVLKDLGCIEALNLDGGGSSCMLVNGKETISPSDKTERAVPAVFIIRKR